MTLRETNSWHWLWVSVIACFLLGGYLAIVVGGTAFEKTAPLLGRMKEHSNELKLLTEEDAALAERQVEQVLARKAAYEAAVLEKVGQPIPEGEQSVLKLSNEINRALLKHELRVIEQEQGKADAEPQAPKRRAIPAPPAPNQNLPFKTEEIRYVLEGEYNQMFMFLVRQSHLKPSYHLKDIRISPAPQSGMRMEFTAQIHYIEK